jgi:branched-chain amino acid transport system substrate-binding protein
MKGGRMKRRKVALTLVLPAALVATAVVVFSASASSTAAPVGSGKASPKKSVCGLGTGKKATGRPLNIGAIVTVAPGVNWDEITDNVRGYFNCVNDNGGIFNRPINYIVHVDPIDPQLVAAFAKKLIEEEKVVAIVGNIDVMDCAVNAKYYASKKFYVIGDGVHDLCYGGTPNHIPINMGPAYSTLGAAQYLVRRGAKSVIAVSPTGVDAAGTWNKPAVQFAKSKGLKAVDVHDPYPTQASYALKYVQLAGKGGGVILDFTTDQVLTVLKAAEQQGIADDVFWAASTPAYDTRFAARAGKFWDGKIGINTELLPFTGKGPDAALYRAVGTKYVKKWGLSSFGQFGFLDARVAVEVMLSLKPSQLTAKGINAAFLRIKNWKSDLLCKPFYSGNLPGHVPNNWDITTTGKNGKMVQLEGCFPIAPVTPEIKAARAAERRLKLNTGTSFPKPAWLR